MSRNAIRFCAVSTSLLVAALTGGPALAVTVAKPTSLTLKAAHSTVKPSQKDTLTGTLKSGNMLLAGQPVKLERRAAGSKTFTVIATKKTDSKGHLVLTVVPGNKKGQKVQYELVFAGNKAYKGSHSSVITVTVT